MVRLVGFLALTGVGCVTVRGQQGNTGKAAPVVAEVNVTGNESFGDDELVEGLATRPPSGLWPFRTVTLYDPLALELDRQRLESYYQKRGFFSAKVERVAVTEGEDVVAVKIDVDEGAPTRVTAVNVQGLPNGSSVTTEDVRDAVGLGAGQRFSYETFALATSAVRDLLVAQGYAYAEADVEARVDRDQHTAAIDVDIEPGPLVHFGDTKFVGLDRVPAEAVIHRIAWEKGQVFDPALLDETQGALYRFDFFSIVRFEFDRDNPGETVDITIQLTEKTRHEIRLGGGVGIDQAHYEIRGRFGYTHRNFLDPLLTLRADLRPAYGFLRGDLNQQFIGGDATVAIDRQDLFFPLLRGRAEIGYSQVEYEAYAINGGRFRAGLDRVFFDGRLLTEVGWLIRYEFFTRIDDAVDAALRESLGFQDDPYRPAYYQQSITVDLRDDPIAPRLGAYFSCQAEEAGAYSGSTFGYMKTVPEARGYLPIGTRLVVAGRGRLGWLPAQDQALPITERFFAGGASSQRGFSQRRLSPRATSAGRSVPIGGEAIFESSVEARYDMFQLAEQWVAAAVFLDGADVTGDLDALDLANLHWATGAGLRYDSPVGPVRFDIGFRLNRVGPGEPDPGDRFAFHLTLGEAF